MRLLDVRTFELRTFHDESKLPPYAILSHVWRDEGEPGFEDVQELSKWSRRTWTRAKARARFSKVWATCHLARRDGLTWIWIDACCVDQTNLVEVQEAVNSSYRWYQDATICYAYLDDLDRRCPILNDSMLDGTSQSGNCAPWIDSFSRCAWFSRGWTLVELLAPRKLRFYNSVWKPVGTRAMLVRVVARITGIDVAVIRRRRALSSVSVAARLSWAANRRTRRVEDRAYCLLGLFEVSMPILYGEGSRAFHRLQEQLISACGDLSILAWSGNQTDDELLANSPDNFTGCEGIISSSTGAACEIRNGRVRVTLPVVRQKNKHSDMITAVLGCRRAQDVDSGLGLRLRQCGGSQYLFSVGTTASTADDANGRLSRIDIGMLKIAEVSTIELVARRDFQVSPGVKFLVKIDHAATVMPSTRIISVQPADMWTAPSQILLPSGEPHFRALFHLSLPSGRDLVLEVGYDESIILKDSGRTFRKHHIPGLRVLFVGRDWDGQRPSWAGKSSYWYCKHKSGCVDGSAITKGCPNTPVLAEIGMPQDPERVRVEVKPKVTMGEELFVVKVCVDSPSKAITTGKEESRPGTGNTDHSTFLPPYSPPRRDPPSYRHSTDQLDTHCVSTAAASPKPRVPPSATQQQILLSNPSGKLWKLYPEGLLEVAEKQKPQPAIMPKRKPIPPKVEQVQEIHPRIEQSQHVKTSPRVSRPRGSQRAPTAMPRKRRENTTAQSSVKPKPSQVWLGMSAPILYNGRIIQQDTQA